MFCSTAKEKQNKTVVWKTNPEKVKVAAQCHWKQYLSFDLSGAGLHTKKQRKVSWWPIRMNACYHVPGQSRCKSIVPACLMTAALFTLRCVLIWIKSYLITLLTV